jgi:hypothetical protein
LLLCLLVVYAPEKLGWGTAHVDLDIYALEGVLAIKVTYMELGLDKVLTRKLQFRR